MNRTTRILLLFVMAVAILLTSFRIADMVSLDRDVRAKQAELAESRAVWEKIASEKEALQAELKQVTNDLKEARLSLSESETRTEELKEEIEGLECEIKALEDEQK